MCPLFACFWINIRKNTPIVFHRATSGDRWRGMQLCHCCLCEALGTGSGHLALVIWPWWFHHWYLVARNDRVELGDTLWFKGIGFILYNWWSLINQWDKDQGMQHTFCEKQIGLGRAKLPTTSHTKTKKWWAKVAKTVYECRCRWLRQWMLMSKTNQLPSAIGADVPRLSHETQ